MIRTQIMKVGFIGLGLMGNPMAKNLHKKGFKLSVYNRSKNKTSEFKKMGLNVCDTPKQLTQVSQVVITMVTGPKDVEEVLFGKDGVIYGAKRGLIVIDMSTIGVKSAKKIAQRLNKLGIEFLDAPVTGSVSKATIGELTIFIGGKKKIFNKCRKIFEAMGTNLQYMGETGFGQAIKLINNAIIGISLTALAEGMLLADSLKLSRKKAAKALENAPLASPMIKMKLPNMVRNKFPTAFSMSNMYKDLKLAKEENNSLPLLKLVESLYKKGVKKGLSEKDNSAILQVLSKSK